MAACQIDQISATHFSLLAFGPGANSVQPKDSLGTEIAMAQIQQGYLYELLIEAN